jgi:hypothetical protein
MGRAQVGAELLAVVDRRLLGGRLIIKSFLKKNKIKIKKLKKLMSNSKCHAIITLPNSHIS